MTNNKSEKLRDAVVAVTTHGAETLASDNAALREENERLRIDKQNLTDTEAEKWLNAFNEEATKRKSAEKALAAVVPLQEFFDYHAPREGCQCEIDYEQQLVDAVRAILDAGKEEPTPDPDDGKPKAGECYDPQRCSNCGKDVDEAPNRITGGFADPDEWFCSSYCYDEHGELGCPFETGDQYRDGPLASPTGKAAENKED